MHLRDEVVEAGEGDLTADAGDELEDHVPVVDVELPELLVEHIGLDTAVTALEGGVGADRDRGGERVVLPLEARPARVDAVSGDEALAVGGEVRRGEAEIASAGVAVDDGALDPVVAAELIGRLGDIA